MGQYMYVGWRSVDDSGPLPSLSSMLQKYSLTCDTHSHTHTLIYQTSDIYKSIVARFFHFLVMRSAGRPASWLPYSMYPFSQSIRKMVPCFGTAGSGGGDGRSDSVAMGVVGVER